MEGHVLQSLRFDPIIKMMYTFLRMLTEIEHPIMRYPLFMLMTFFSLAITKNGDDCNCRQVLNKGHAYGPLIQCFGVNIWKCWFWMAK